MKYTTSIKHGEWKDGDIICFPMDHKLGNRYDKVCKVKHGKILELPERNEIVPQKNWKCIRIDYKFISRGEWFIEDTEAYPTNEVNSESDWNSAIFVGWTQEGVAPYARWDGESCPLTEFTIEKRTRKVYVILKNYLGATTLESVESSKAEAEKYVKNDHYCRYFEKEIT